MRPLPGPARVALYLVAGGLFGFLFLGEFALSTLLPVDLALVALALAGAIGAARRQRSLELWPVFVAAALVLPVSFDARLVRLPRCGDVARGVACLDGTRDIVTPFAVELTAFAVSLVGIAVLIARERVSRMRSTR